VCGVCVFVCLCVCVCVRACARVCMRVCMEAVSVLVTMGKEKLTLRLQCYGSVRACRCRRVPHHQSEPEVTVLLLFAGRDARMVGTKRVLGASIPLLAAEVHGHSKGG
jgi:hypothetical protein